MSLLTVWLLAAAAAASPPRHERLRPQPLVRTVPGDISVCPEGFDDCHLTSVDSTLCAFLSELLNPLVDNFHDHYNCDNREEGVYSCVNVLGRRRTDTAVKTDYTYPYLIELADDYERQLDKCLPVWQKDRSLSGAGQSISYAYGNRVVVLSIVPFEHGGAYYDRLNLKIHAPVPKR
jgi:hypothetical protein